MIFVEKVAVESIPAIKQLACTTWAKAYKEILSSAQIQYMLELIYSEAALAVQIKEKRHQFLLVTDDEKKQAVGFASYSVKNDKDPATFRLHKIYVDPNQQGKGIGKLLLDFIINDIRPGNATQLELNVNRHNKALGFYQKFGFKIIRQEDIAIGKGYFMNDYVMSLALNS